MPSVPFIPVLFYWWIGANLLGAVLTVADKQQAKRRRWRIPERTLMTVGILGGALLMFLTMKCIRHKTRHRLFMWGLPACMALHLLLLAGWLFLM